MFTFHLNNVKSLNRFRLQNSFLTLERFSNLSLFFLLFITEKNVYQLIFFFLLPDSSVIFEVLYFTPLTPTIILRKLTFLLDTTFVVKIKLLRCNFKVILSQLHIFHICYLKFLLEYFESCFICHTCIFSLIFLIIFQSVGGRKLNFEQINSASTLLLYF